MHRRNLQGNEMHKDKNKTSSTAGTASSAMAILLSAALYLWEWPYEQAVLNENYRDLCGRRLH
eukprot:2260895-Amphidinium_carterae.1